MEAWRIHDLRLTATTRMNDLGADPYVVDAILNHVSGEAKRGVRGVYNRSAYTVKAREALVKWGEHVAAVTGGWSNVVHLHGAAR
jgi:hypothetical protein